MPGVTDWQQREVTLNKDQSLGSRFGYITEKPDLHHQLGTNFGLLVDTG